METIQEQIQKLKKERDAVILAHLYQIPDIQDIADFVGDSLELSRKARDMDREVIVLCGVYFMAESAKILNPEKTVLLPELRAGCPMADMITPPDIEKLRSEYPEAAVVCYVNSSAEVKAASDICCTSSNAVRVVASLPQKQILFVPDQNLGYYVSTQVHDKEIIPFQGYCPTHHFITVNEVAKSRAAHPDALMLVHPECTRDVLEKADFIGSTSQIIQYVKESPKDEFIIGTEKGILHRLGLENPNKRFYLMTEHLHCPNMKRTTLQSVLQSLQTMQHAIEMDPDTMQKALRSLDRMLAV